MDGIRAFVCIEIPEEVKERIEKTVSQIDVHEVRAAKRDQLHITLFFFEKISEKQVSQIMHTMAGVMHGPFRIEMEGVGTFEPRRPNLIFAGVKDSTEILKLYQELSPALRTVGFKNEERPLTPHVTIARARDMSKETIGKVAAFLEANRDANFGSFECTEIVLKQSTLTASGPVYKTLFSKVLGP
jgi:RNA 2',3'-cyclic 3'-phosphodiesterase